MTPFRQKAENFILFGISDKDQIMELQMVSHLHLSAFATVTRNPLLELFYVSIAIANSIVSKYYL